MGKWFKKGWLCNRPRYPEKLITVIEKYKLWKFDGSKKQITKSKDQGMKKVTMILTML